MTNGGLIIGGLGAHSGGGSYGGVGIDLTGGSLINRGSITGGYGGDVMANASFSNVLELAPGGKAGTIANLGAQIFGFGTIEFDPSAAWLVAGNAAGLVVSNNGGAKTIANSGGRSPPAISISRRPVAIPR